MSTFPEQALFTTFTSKNSRQTKLFYEQDGQLIKDGGTLLYEGYARTSAASSLREFNTSLDSLTQNQMISIGLFSRDLGKSAEITTKPRLEELEKQGSAPPGLISRSLKYFSFHPTPGFLFLDLDSDWITPENSPHVLEAIQGNFQFIPDLVLSILNIDSFLIRPSVSSRVYLPPATPQPPKSWHIYVPVADASKIPLYVKTCFQRLLLAGLGFTVFSHATKGKAQIYLKSLIDESVKSPERAIYEAPPITTPPVCLTPPEPPIISGDGRYQEFLPLSSDQLMQAEQISHTLKQSRIQDLNLLNQRLQSVFVEEQLRQRVPPNSSDAFIQQIKTQAINAFERSDQFLTGGQLVKMDGAGFQTISTMLSADIFARVMKNDPIWHKKTCADPLEPGYGDGKAQIYTDFPAKIHTFAHGGHTHPIKLLAQDIATTLHQALQQNVDISTQRYLLKDLWLAADIPQFEKSQIIRDITNLVQNKDHKKIFKETIREADNIRISDTAEVLFAGIDQIIPDPAGLGAYIYEHFPADYIKVGAKTWFIYDNEWTETDAIEPVCAKIVSFAENLADLHPKKAERIRSKQFREDTAAFIAIKAFRAERPNFNKDPFIVATPRSVIDFHDFSIREKLKTDLVTFSTKVDPIPGPTPIFDQFIYNMAGQDIEFLLDLEYVMTHAAFNGIGKHVIFLIGPSNSGKSALLRLLEDLLGTYCETVEPDLFVAKQSTDNVLKVNALRGKKLAMCNELPTGGRLNTEALKRVSSGDTTKGRNFYQNPSSFSPFASLLLAANHYPTMTETDRAMTNRIININLTNTFVEPNGRLPDPTQNEFPAIPKLQEKLKAELPQILHKLIQRSFAYARQDTFHIPERFYTSYRDIDTDDVHQEWADRCLVVTSQEGEEITDFATFKDIQANFEMYLRAYHPKKQVRRKDLETFLTNIGVHTAREGEVILRESGKTACVSSARTVKIDGEMVTIRKNVRLVNAFPST